MRLLLAAFLMVHFALSLSAVDAFALLSSKPLSRSTVFVGSDNSGADLFPAEGSSYVPSGLTPNEYAKIKKNEQERLSKLNYGAFGPRFLTTAKPNGDWMIDPSLWTSGFQSNRGKSFAMANRGSPGGKAQPSRIKNVLDTLRLFAPSFLLAYVLMDCFATGMAMLRVARTQAREIPFMALKFIVWQRWHNIDLRTSMLGIHLLKTLAAGILSYPVKQGMDTINRRYQWSPKRIVTTSVLSSFTVLCALGFLLASLR